MFKKVTSFAIVIFFISIGFLTNITYADNRQGGSLVVSTVSGKAGDIVNINVSVLNNPGIATFNLKINFDNTKLEPVSITKGAVIAAGDITSNIHSSEDLSRFTYVSAFWVNPYNIADSGALYTIQFKIKNSAHGSTPITISYEQSDIANQFFDDVEMNIVNGAVNIFSNNAILINSTEPNADGEIYATVSLENNPGIATFMLKLNFDNTKLEPVAITKGSILTAGDISSNVNTGGNLNSLTFVSAFWVNPYDVEGDGAIFTVKFKIKQHAVGESYFDVEYDEGNISNQSFDDVDFEFAKATVWLGGIEQYEIEIINSSFNTQNDFMVGDINIGITNNRLTPTDAIAIAAVYDDEGNILNTKYSSNVFLSVGVNSVTIEGICVPISAEQNYTIKVMCWTSLDEMKPIATDKSFEL